MSRRNPRHQLCPWWSAQDIGCCQDCGGTYRTSPTQALFDTPPFCPLACSSLGYWVPCPHPSPPTCTLTLMPLTSSSSGQKNKHDPEKTRLLLEHRTRVPQIEPDLQPAGSLARPPSWGGRVECGEAACDSPVSPQTWPQALCWVMA